jgi:hypothetical protein
VSQKVVQRNIRVDIYTRWLQCTALPTAISLRYDSERLLFVCPVVVLRFFCRISGYIWQMITIGWAGGLGNETGMSELIYTRAKIVLKSFFAVYNDIAYSLYSSFVTKFG